MKNVVLQDDITSSGSGGTGGGTGGGTSGGLTESQVRTYAREEANIVAGNELDVASNLFIRVEEIVKRDSSITENYLYSQDDKLTTIEYTRSDGGKYIKTFVYEADGRLRSIEYTDSTGTIAGITPAYSKLKRTLNYNSTGQFTSFSYDNTGGTV